MICQKSKIDDWVEHFNTYYPDYSVFDLTKKIQAVRFRELIETDKVYDYDLQIVGVINYDLAFRRPYIAHIRDFTLTFIQYQVGDNGRYGKGYALHVEDKRTAYHYVVYYVK